MSIKFTSFFPQPLIPTVLCRDIGFLSQVFQDQKNLGNFSIRIYSKDRARPGLIDRSAGAFYTAPIFSDMHKILCPLTCFYPYKW